MTDEVGIWTGADLGSISSSDPNTTSAKLERTSFEYKTLVDVEGLINNKVSQA